MSTELHRRFRPEGFQQILGQDEVVSLLKAKLKDKTLPHTILLHGATGVGKTSLARILSTELVCTGPNLTEINCADVRGIDSVREIQSVMRLAPMGGKCRIWILDEIVQLPKASQQAFLKVLEEPPSHVYFILCTTDVSGLLPTFLGRCFRLDLRPLSERHVRAILNNALGELKTTLEDDIFVAIAAKADGSARKALQLLEAVLAVPSEERMDVLRITAAGTEEKVEFLAKTLLKYPPVEWIKMAHILKSMQDSDLEGLRRQVLAYCSVILLSNVSSMRAKAYQVIKSFAFSWAESGKAGLIAACWEVLADSPK